MVEDPGIEISFRAGSDWSFGGPLASRVRDVVGGILQAQQSSTTGAALAPARIEVVSTAPEHAGLGVGTQLSLGVARGLYELAGLPPPTAEQLAALTGRGRRSGVGLHGFRLGGLIVDGGYTIH